MILFLASILELVEKTPKILAWFVSATLLYLLVALRTGSPFFQDLNQLNDTIDLMIAISDKLISVYSVFAGFLMAAKTIMLSVSDSSFAGVILSKNNNKERMTKLISSAILSSIGIVLFSLAILFLFGKNNPPQALWSDSCIWKKISVGLLGVFSIYSFGVIAHATIAYCLIFSKDK